MIKNIKEMISKRADLILNNYKKANLVPFFLTGNTKQTQNNKKSGELPKEDDYPEDCIVDFEWQLIKTKAQEFISMVENTSMSKTYKMPILLAFYNKGNFKLKINEDQIYIRFKEFYNKGSNGVDMLKHKLTAEYKNWDKKKYVKLAKDNPINFLAKSHSEFFYIEDSYFCINDELEIWVSNDLPAAVIISGILSRISLLYIFIVKKLLFEFYFYIIT